MKKLICLVLAAVLALSLAACGGNGQTKADNVIVFNDSVLEQRCA